MITKKDLLIIFDALIYYDTILEDSAFVWKNHKENYGNPNKTMDATRRRIRQMIEKKGMTL